METDKGAALIIAVSLALGFIGLMIASLWRVFEKANHPGWACVIPLYNTYVMLNIAGMSGFWLLVALIPYVRWLVYIVVSFGVASAFRKNGWFGLGLLLLPFIFYPLLAFGERERYYGPSR